ncbi:MAG TPA: TetR/AcrR family transcriptional regulator [Dehalococcoidia bacterium]|nr:TetR/AcrR family transcriptional regulator [Dehalococcoidia bacterium]
MSKLKPQEVEQRKREIIEAARLCFLRSGFHQTTTDEICHEASITPGGLYHYFGSKEEIISAVIEDAAHTIVNNLRSTAEASGDLRSAVRALASLFFERIRDPQLDGVTRLDVEIWAETLRNEKLAEITRESRALRREWLETLICRAVDEGVYTKDVDARGLANLIMAIFDGLRLGRLLWRDDFDLDGALKALVLMQTGRLMNGNHVALAPKAPAAGRS